ncbi:phage tail tape measure C-terminal domain-containing protein [Pseudorhodobacter sp.]|uniref:phage tail tape measure C-terminal domain-containing protein n=1 Tax=Pseudorhodobacter sp. TaxID=1934400 RepID=UPI002AFF10AD|nr:phage tail tape measure C-terminal domain-containing protein [Pseudorhodobacter sp.]
MSEKRVFVRLAAVGGRQVKAELQGVGEAGGRGMRRLSTEIESANARLAAFTRRARIAAAAAGAAVAAAGVAMIRSGLQTVDAQAKLAQSLGTTVESLQVLERAGELAGVSMSGIEQATKDMTRRLSQAAASGGPAAAALDRLNLSAETLIGMPLDQRIAAVSAAMTEFVPEAKRAAVAGQIFGEEGSIAMSRIDTATLRQATQDVRDFGIVVSEQDADQIERTNDAISRLGLIWRGVSNQLAVAAAPALEAVADAMAVMARTTGPLGMAIQGLFANLGRLTTYATTFAAFLAGRWVAGLAVAALSVKGLATALVFLRGALIRTGIGALIVGAGELVYQFTRLVSGAGGFGNAMSLLKDVAVEVWDRVSLSASAAWARVESGWASAQAVIYDGLQGATDAVVGWGNSAVGTFQGAFDAVKAIWGALPQAIGDFVFQAANGLIGGVESMLNAVVTRINSFIETLNSALALLPEWATGEGGVRIGTLNPVALGGIENPYEGAAAAAGNAAGEAFRAAMGQTYVESPNLFGGMADDARGRASGYSEAAGMLSDAASRPMTAWQALKDAVSGTTTALEETSTTAGEVSQSFDDAAAAGGRAGGAGKKAAEETKTGWDAVVATLADYAKKARDVGADIGNALVGAFQGAENAIGEFVKTGKLDFRSLVTSLLADLAKLAARKFILGPIANALGGALGGLGGIFAGVFHSGGMVGGSAPSRMVPAMAFANAPRMHDGGWAGLKSDEVPAILQRGERVLSRRETRGYGGGGVTVNINARDVESFRQSRTQVAADIARAVSMGRRGM